MPMTSQKSVSATTMPILRLAISQATNATSAVMMIMA